MLLIFLRSKTNKQNKAMDSKFIAASNIDHFGVF